MGLQVTGIDNIMAIAEVMAQQLLALRSVEAVHLIDLHEDTYEPDLKFRLVAVVSNELAEEYLRCYLTPRPLPRNYIESLPEKLWELLGIKERRFHARVSRALKTPLLIEWDVDYAIVLLPEHWPSLLEQLRSKERIVPGYPYITKPFATSEWRNSTYYVFDPATQQFGGPKKA